MAPSTTTTMEFIATSSVVLQVRRLGPGHGVPLVFINSLGSDSRIWDGVVERLPDRRAVLYDKRGHGLSDCPPAPYTISDHSRDLAELLAALEVSTCVLVGISVGGMIALDFAARHAGRVEALVLCDTGPKIGTAELWDNRIAAIRESGMGSAGEASVSRWFGKEFQSQRPAEYRGYKNMVSRTPLEGYIGTCHALREADLWGELAELDMPCLVVCGSNDVSTPPELCREMADRLPRSRYFEIEGAGHLPCIERPEIVAKEISRFLEVQQRGR